MLKKVVMILGLLLQYLINLQKGMKFQSNLQIDE